MARRKDTGPPHALVPGLKALGAKHRKAVAEAIGAAAATPEAIAAILLDEDALADIVAGLGNEERLLLTRLACGPLYAWSSGARSVDHAAAATLERHGLLFMLESHWSTTAAIPFELEGPAQRIRARACAATAEDHEPAPGELTVHVPDQLLHDAAAIAAVIGAGGIQIKADGDLFARAVPKLFDALAPLPAMDGVLDDIRLNHALTLLQENSALRVRGGGMSTTSAKRELTLDRDIAALFDVDAAGRARLMDAPDLMPRPGAVIIDLLLDACHGRIIGLEALGATLRRLFGEAAKQFPRGDHSTPEAVIGTTAVAVRWLRGDVGYVLDANGLPVAVAFVPAPGVESGKPPCVAQGDFELVTMRPSTPGERAALLSVAESVPGREHVTRITKARIHAALRADPTLDVIARLQRLAGILPQNVEETVRGWAGQAPARARLRTAMMLAVADEAVADRLAFALGAVMVERLSPTLLAVDARDLPAVAKAVTQAGVELEEGLDRISGVWRERPDHEANARWWRPTPDGQRPVAQPPAGRLVSRLDWREGEPESAPDPAPGGWASGGITPSEAARRLAERLADAGVGPEDFDQDTLLSLLEDELADGEEADSVEELLMDACETGSVVRLKYAGAGGLRQEWVTIKRLDDARVQVRDQANGKRSWLWLRGISEAQIIV